MADQAVCGAIECIARLQGGAELTGRCEFMKGDPANPHRPEDVERKFFSLAGSVWGQSGGTNIEGNCDGASDCLRYSTGVGVSWYSPFGPIKLVLAKPLNEQEGDKTEVLQFQLGSQF